MLIRQEFPVCRAELRIDTIDPAYYTVAHGDGQTTASAEADLDVGSYT